MDRNEIDYIELILIKNNKTLEQAGAELGQAQYKIG